MIPYYLYILALEDDYYYVGITQDVYQRYCEHADRKGAHFTRIHHPLGLICSRELSTWTKQQAEQEETKMTLVMMSLFGVEQVRGGDYYNADFYDVKRCMGEPLYKKMVDKHRKIDVKKVYKEYPEIKYGLDLIDRHIDFPVNVGSYRVWPTKDYYEKKISFKKKKSFHQDVNDAKNAYSDTKDEQIISDDECKTLTLKEYGFFDIATNFFEKRLLPIYLDDGTQVIVELHISDKKAYVDTLSYTDETMEELRRLFRKWKNKK